jgi:hypothetical protein
MYSVYIPHIPVSYDSYMVAEIFNLFTIGRVERVDFLAPHESNTRIRQAFVHFHAYSSVPMTTMIQKHAAHESYRMIVDNQGHYWDLCENKRPVPESDLNVHQLAENLRILQSTFETKLAELTAKIAVIPQLHEEIADLKSRVKYLEDPEWLLSTANGFSNTDVNGPLTMSMLHSPPTENDTMDNLNNAFIQEDDVCDEDMSDDITLGTSSSYIMSDEDDNQNESITSGNSHPNSIRHEIERHFVESRANVTPILCADVNVYPVSDDDEENSLSLEE